MGMIADVVRDLQELMKDQCVPCRNERQMWMTLLTVYYGYEVPVNNSTFYIY